MAGISGTFRRGAYSVVLSGGYVDNIDKGDTLYAPSPFFKSIQD